MKFFFNMAQFFKKNKTTFKVNIPDSIKNGLQQYGQLIRSGAAFSEEMALTFLPHAAHTR
ncbi:hypothetical protein DSLASN_20070 [Desulfoluna limicola]|uniref:Uncharacterized protein n=1 Tax=Desulfoluna limicola TaxID=2810562 RepID=A0ABM7PGQ6_9BACT|nr:hypothetical protein DSLASN_20070 [Desulfoluna limicola]